MDQLLDDFKGRILPSASVPEFDSVDTVILEPADHDSDLVTALKLAAADNRPVVVRSGSQFKSKATDDDLAGAVVLKLAPWPSSVMHALYTLQLSAIETLGTLADKAAAVDLALPIDDANKLRSVISYVLAMKPAFPCSSPHPALLIDRIASVHVIYMRHPQQQRDLSGEEFRSAVEAGTLPFVVTRLRFQSEESCKERWFNSWETVFDPNTAKQLITALDSADALNGIDLTMRAQSGPFGISLIVLRATGIGDEQQRQRLIDFIEGALQQSQVVKQLDARGAKAIALWMALSPVEKLPERLFATTTVKSDTARPLSTVADPFVRAASFLVGLNPDGSDPTPGIMAWIMLRRSATVANAVDVHAQMMVNEMVASPEQVEEGHRLLQQLKGHEQPPNRRVSEMLNGFASKTTLEIRSAGAGVIPGLKGDLFRPGTAWYAAKAYQYATSSYDAATIAQRMSPHMIVVPKTEADVVAVVEYAVAHSLHIVTRSGGHQYCGMSSGGPDSIQLSMEEFDSVAIAADGTMTVGVGTTLFKLSSALFMANVALPHGECPLVAAGGHIQTGGVGHLLRILGLALDYVKAFKMVTVGPDKKAIVKHYQRPEPGAQDDGVFAAVLGGGPGSWGVVLSYEMEVVHNMPGTVGYSYYYLYSNFLHDSKRTLTTVLYKMQEWNQRLVQGQLPDGQDLFVTFLSGQHLRPSLIFVEAAATTPEGATDIRLVVEEANAVQPPILKKINGDTTLSRIAHLGVRDLLLGMPGGRELLWPYKKSAYCTRKAFDKGFIDRFVDLVDRADKAPDTAVVVQMIIGGGKLANPRQACNRMQRRDSTCIIVFDIFYESRNPDAEKRATSYQKEFISMLQSFSDGDKRMFWGSFENDDRGASDTDMSDPQVQNYYYNSTNEYQSLQEIKKKVDPLNVFHTRFTVQL